MKTAKKRSSKTTKATGKKTASTKRAIKGKASDSSAKIPEVDLTGRTPAELKRLQASLSKQIEKQIASQKISKLRDAYDEMLAVAEKYNTTIDKVLKACRPQRGRNKLGKVEPKYRNKDNPDQTWSGRGQQPVWMREAIAAGARKEDFLIRK